MRPRWPALLGALALVAPAPAFACSSCFYGDSNVLLVYFGTAVLMSSLPLAMVGALALWLRRRLRQRAAAPAGPSPSPTSSPHLLPR